MKNKNQMYDDIHKITNYLSEIRRNVSSMQCDIQFIYRIIQNDHEEKKHPFASAPLFSPSPSISPSVAPNTWPSCENCWWYQQQKGFVNSNITIGDTPCNWCPKMKITATCEETKK